MRKLFLLLIWFGLLGAAEASDLKIRITEGATGAQPIAIVPFGVVGNQAVPHDIAAIVSADLKRSGRFEPLSPADMISHPHSGKEVVFRDWKALGTDSLVIGQIEPNGPGGFRIRFQLFDVLRGEQQAGYTITTTTRDLRATAHQIADLIYEKLTGERGAFATRIAYVTAERSGDSGQELSLIIADSDGYGPQTILRSEEPIMSPAWSPDGLKLAYVSFENGRPSIFVQEAFTGKRFKVTGFRGINGAPAWSPDGTRLALTLSKDGNSEIYVLDVASRGLQRLTNHYAIDTEPAWSPDGQSIVFTSSRGGLPQIYSIPSAGGTAKRVTFDGKYNARASYSPDGRLLALVTRANGKYRIGVYDLARGQLTVLTDGALDESPSFAPNGRMIIYATKIGGKGELAAVSTDGRVKQQLHLQKGDVREPAWSPHTRSFSN